MSDLDTALIAAHRGNIDRYRRLLRTRLTEHERAFIERRLAEERSSLAALLGRRQPRFTRPAVERAGASTVIAADALASRAAAAQQP